MRKDVNVYLRDELRQAGYNSAEDVRHGVELLALCYPAGLLDAREEQVVWDACNGFLLEPHTAHLLWAQVEDACHLNRLGERYKIDCPALVEKLRNLHRAEAWALVKRLQATPTWPTS